MFVFYEREYGRWVNPNFLSCHFTPGKMCFILTIFMVNNAGIRQCTFSFLTFWSRLEIEAPILAMHKAKKKQSLHLCQKEHHTIKGNKCVNCDKNGLFYVRAFLRFSLLTFFFLCYRSENLEKMKVCWYSTWIICEDPRTILIVFALDIWIIVRLETFMRKKSSYLYVYAYKDKVKFAKWVFCQINKI